MSQETGGEALRHGLGEMVRTGSQDGPEGARRPRLVLFDSGLGGLSVHAEVARLRPEADLLYVADDAIFPYGNLPEDELVSRVMAVLGDAIARHTPDIVVIACNTASTAVLPPLRARWPEIGFVGTVPAVKPAAAVSRSRRISVLATPGTVARDYTRALVAAYAGDCRVDLVGASRLASLAEAGLRGQPIADEAVLAEIAPAFVDCDGRRTDVVALACTHYPLILETLERLAPWPVVYVDPAPAIARRADALLGDRGFAGAQSASLSSRGRMVFTSGRAPSPSLAAALARRGLTCS